MRGKYVVVTGPSGAGKTTLVDRFLAAESSCCRLVTVTTRAPRPKEIAGVDYLFTTVEDFKARISVDEFFEHAETYDAFYGSSRLDLARLLDRHPVVFGVLDAKGARTVKTKMPESLVIMLTSPLEELRDRLERRFGAGSDKARRRLEEAEREMSDQTFCDIVMPSHDGEMDRMVAALRGHLESYLVK
ncbi:guanylate kinase [Candidatus Uhrbacteria bacterium]|nr:guanylate kinase [Candidatus Uhrbacteria bacterium]